MKTTIIGLALILLACLTARADIPESAAAAVDDATESDAPHCVDDAEAMSVAPESILSVTCAGGPGSPYCLWCLSGGCHGQQTCWAVCLLCCR